MKKHLSPKTFFTLALISIGISIYQFITASLSIGLISIFYALVLGSAGLNRMIIQRHHLKHESAFPKYFLGSFFFIGFFAGAALVYIIFIELTVISF